MEYKKYHMINSNQFDISIQYKQSDQDKYFEI